MKALHTLMPHEYLTTGKARAVVRELREEKQALTLKDLKRRVIRRQAMLCTAKGTEILIIRKEGVK